MPLVKRISFISEKRALAGKPGRVLDSKKETALSVSPKEKELKDLFRQAQAALPGQPQKSPPLPQTLTYGNEFLFRHRISLLSPKGQRP